MTAYDAWLQAPYADDDTAASEARRDRRAAEIFADQDQLFDAVYGESFPAEALTELRIVLRNAAPAIDMLTHGDSLDTAMDTPMRAHAMRELFRAVKTCNEIVKERVLKAADELVAYT